MDAVISSGQPCAEMLYSSIRLMMNCVSEFNNVRRSASELTQFAATAPHSSMKVQIFDVDIPKGFT